MRTHSAVVAAVLAVLGACVPPSVRLGPVIAGGDTTTAHAYLLEVGPRLDSLLARVAAPLDSGFGASERAALMTRFADSVPKRPIGGRWIEAGYVVRAAGRAMSLEVRGLGWTREIEQLSLHSDDAALAAYLREAAEADEADHSQPVGPVRVAVNEAPDGSGQLDLAILTAEQNAYAGSDLRFHVDSLSEPTVVRVHGLYARSLLAGPVVGPQGARARIPGFGAHGVFDIDVRGRRTRFIVEQTDSTRRVQRSGGSSASTDERVWWRPPPWSMGIRCTVRAPNLSLCDDVLHWASALPGATPVTPPQGAISPFGEIGGDPRMHAVLRLDGPASIPLIRSCLATMEPRLEHVHVFGLAVTLPSGEQIQVASNTQADDRIPSPLTRLTDVPACSGAGR